MQEAPVNDCFSTPRRAASNSVVDDGSSPQGPATSGLAYKLAGQSLKAPKKRSDAIEGGYRRRNRAFDPDNLTIS